LLEYLVPVIEILQRAFWNHVLLQVQVPYRPFHIPLCPSALDLKLHRVVDHLPGLLPSQFYHPILLQTIMVRIQPLVVVPNPSLH